jgi:aminopeptidase N
MASKDDECFIELPQHEIHKPISIEFAYTGQLTEDRHSGVYLAFDPQQE